MQNIHLSVPIVEWQFFLAWSLVLPVIVGLASGIALVIIFASIFGETKAQGIQSYDDKEFVAAAASLREAQVFAATYKNATVEVDRYRLTDGISVVYYHEKLYTQSPEFPFPSQYATAELIIPMQQGLLQKPRPDFAGMTLRCSATSVERIDSMGYVVFPSSRPDITMVKAIQLTGCAK